MPRQTFIKLYTRTWNENSSEIRPCATEAQLSRLMEEYEVDIVSIRPNSMFESLDAWLRRNFPSLKFNIILTGDHTRSKLYNGHDIFIDDAPSLAKEFIDEEPETIGKHNFVPRHPWNERILSRNGRNTITIVRNLTHAISILTGEENVPMAGASARQKNKLTFIGRTQRPA